MKKQVAAMVCTAILISSCTWARAEEYFTLPQVREQAAGGWHETYTDKYGRELTVDLEIEVYGEDVAPVIKAKWHDPQTLHESVNSPHDPSNAEDRKGNPQKMSYDAVQNMDVDFDTVYSPELNNTMTYGEFCELFEEIKAIYGLDKTYLFEQPNSFTVFYNTSKKTGEVIIPAFYSVSFWQMEFGLPIIMHASSSFKKDGYGPAASPRMALGARSVNEYSFDGTIFDIDEILADDIPLCSVEDVLDSAGEFIETGYVYSVEALRFGYVVFSDPELQYGRSINSYEVDTSYYVPTWVMDCYLRDNPKKDEISKYPSLQQLMINAQTGKMVDFFDKSLSGHGDYRYQGFISWDDVRDPQKK